MNLLVTGATGFIGSSLLGRLVADPRVEHIVALHRQEPPRSWNDEKIVPLHGDLGCLRSYTSRMPIDVVVHLAGFWKSEDRRLVARVNREGTQDVVDFCHRNAVPRLVFTSTINVKLQRKGAYAENKLAAEAIIRDSGLRYLILRPTVVYGRGDPGLSRIVRTVERSPLVPVFGDGHKLEQPIHIDELLELLVQAIHSQVAERTLELGGRDALSFNELVQTIARVKHKRVQRVHIPVGLALAITKAFEALRLPFPITSEQIYHMDEDLAVDMSEALALFPVELSSFESHLRDEHA